MFNLPTKHLHWNPQDDIKHLVSILLSLIPMVVFLFIKSPINALIESTQLSVTAKMMILSVIFVCITVIPCYFLCRRHPGSALYVPGVITLTSFWILSGSLPDYWTRNPKLWLMVTALVLGTIVAIIGSLKGDTAGKEEQTEGDGQEE